MLRRMKRYVLIHWPESQEFIGHPECFLAQNTNEELDSAYFVPEDVYCKTTGMMHRFTKTVKNEELQQILAQHPKDAKVAVEYCDVKKLRYFKDQNLIAID